jgi:glucuronate isomerase
MKSSLQLKQIHQMGSNSSLKPLYHWTFGVEKLFGITTLLNSDSAESITNC